jgi:hypothetical protein
VPQARELLAPVYGWFTEGFDTSEGVAGGVGELASCGVLFLKYGCWWQNGNGAAVARSPFP